MHLIADSHLISFQYGYRWTASSREQSVPPLHGLANRVDQAYTNFMETFPFFAAVVLAAHLTGPSRHPYHMGSTSLLLGAARLRARRRDRLRDGAFCRVLQHSADGDYIVLDCPAPMISLYTQTPNQAMQPTAPDRTTTGVFATDPCRGLSLSR